MRKCQTTALALGLLVSLASTAFAQGHVDYSAWMQGARIDYKSGRYGKAAAKFRSAVAEKPNSADARYWLGLSLAQVGKESLAVAAYQFDSCFALDTSYLTKTAADQDNSYLATNALFTVANAKMLEGAYLDAARLAKWALQINPNNPAYYMTLGNAYVQLDMTDSIVAVAQQLLQRDPEAPQAPYFMAIYYSKKNQMDSSLVSFREAGIRYEKAIQKNKDKLVTVLKLKVATDADPIATRLIALRNNTTGLKEYIEQDLKQSKNLQQVAVIANDLYIDQLQVSSAYYKAGVAAIQAGDAASDTLVQKRWFWLSDTLFRHAAQADAENFDALWYLGYANYRLGRDTAAIDGFRQTITLSESRKDYLAAKDKELWYYLGTSEARIRQYDSSIVHLHRAIDADPTNVVAYDNLAFVFKDMAKGPKEQMYTDSALKVLDDKELTGLRITVWNRSDTSALGRMTDLKGNRFVVVDFSLFNKNTKPDSANPNRLFITGEDKKDYPVDAEATALEELEGRGMKDSALEPNQKLDAIAIFSLPKSVKAVSIVYKPKSGSEARAILK